jgi:hypothetical protein
MGESMKVSEMVEGQPIYLSSGGTLKGGLLFKKHVYYKSINVDYIGIADYNNNAFFPTKKQAVKETLRMAQHDFAGQYDLLIGKAQEWLLNHKIKKATKKEKANV